jgi:hypothetical protein
MPARYVALVSSLALLLVPACKNEVEANPETCAAQVTAAGCEAVIPVGGDAPGHCQWTVQRKLTDACAIEGEAREACIYIDGAEESCDGAGCAEEERHLWVDSAGWTIVQAGDCSGTPIAPDDGPAFTACTDDVGVCACACEPFDDDDTSAG